MGAGKLQDNSEKLDMATARYTDYLEDKREDVERGEAMREDRALDEWKESRWEDSQEMERSRFSDVDE